MRKPTRHKFRPHAFEGLEDRVVPSTAGTFSAAQLQTIQAAVAQDFDQATGAYLQAALTSLAPPTSAGAASGAGTLTSAAVSQQLATLSQQLGTTLSALPSSVSSVLAPVMQDLVTGSGPGSLQQELATIPASVYDTGDAGTIEEALYLRQAIAAFGSAKLDALTVMDSGYLALNAGASGFDNTNGAALAQLGTAKTATAQAFDTAAVSYLQAALTSLAPGAGSGTSLGGTTATQLASLSQQLGTALAGMPGNASAYLNPMLQGLVNGSSPASIQQSLGALPQSVGDTGNLGTFEEALYLRTAIDSFESARLAALDSETIAFLAMNALASGATGAGTNNAASVQIGMLVSGTGAGAGVTTTTGGSATTTSGNGGNATGTGTLVGTAVTPGFGSTIAGFGTTGVTSSPTSGGSTSGTSGVAGGTGTTGTGTGAGGTSTGGTGTGSTSSTTTGSNGGQTSIGTSSGSNGGTSTGGTGTGSTSSTTTGANGGQTSIGTSSGSNNGTSTGGTGTGSTASTSTGSDGGQTSIGTSSGTGNVGGTGATTGGSPGASTGPLSSGNGTIFYNP